MAKGKLSTPDWIKEGYKSKEEYERKKGIKEKGKTGKTYKIKVCPKCGSSNVSVVLVGEEGKKANDWECKACKWRGRGIDDKELNEDEFLEHMEKMEGK
jgi:transcription elongation factor Elf1